MWQYWRVLSELHCGISYIGTRALPFEKTAAGEAAYINVMEFVYYDFAEGSWSIKYDAADNPEKILKQITNGNSRQWKTIEIPFTDGYFGNRSLSNADLVIENTDATECILHMVGIVR